MDNDQPDNSNSVTHNQINSSLHTDMNENRNNGFKQKRKFEDRGVKNKRFCQEKVANGKSQPKNARMCLPLINAEEYEEKCSIIAKITTGSKEIDKILGGGILTHSITEIYGESSVGKTQLCHTICVTAQLPFNQGGGNGKAIYIDTEGTFRPDILKKISKRYGLNEEKVLDNIIYARAHNSDHQSQLLEQAISLMDQGHYSVLVIDSATALYRTDYVGKGELSDRQQKLAQFMRILNKLANQFGVAVVITNQVSSSFDNDNQNINSIKKDKVVPIGGNILAHASTTRLKLHKTNNGCRLCKVVDSPSLPECETQFNIGDCGINDPEE